MDWSRSVSRRVRLALQVPLGQWPELAAIFGWLLVADLALRTLPYRRASALLTGRVRKRTSLPSEEETLALSARIDSVARYHLYPMQCLRRALVLRRLLARRGAASQIRFGVRKEGGRLIAHAWVERDGRSLDRGAEKRYARLETTDALPLFRGPVPPREEDLRPEAPSARLLP